MRIIKRITVLIGLTVVMTCFACVKKTDIDLGGDAGQYGFPTLNGLDLLVVVDNSNSMGEEQLILAEGVASLIETLMNPGADKPYASVDDIRMAVISTDMGLGNAGLPADPENWEGDVPEGCTEIGDNGGFYCELVSPDENSEQITQCITEPGVHGCGYEQQLQSAITALTRDDQSGFVREGRLLTLLVVSDEDDCSFSDDSAWEDLDPTQLSVNICAQENLVFSVTHFYDLYRELKDFDSASVLFAAVTGTPVTDLCQGKGDEISGCLDHQDMQENVTYACERGEVTSAHPARRFVKLAQLHGNLGYIYSICNDDWTSAMAALADTIGSRLAGIGDWDNCGD